MYGWLRVQRRGAAKKLRATSALDCCDGDAISWGCSGDYVRDVMLEAIEKRFGGELPTSPVQGLRDNGSAYTAEQPWAFAWQIGLLPLTTPVCSPQSNCMAESFVKTMKRDYPATCPNPIERRPCANWLSPSSITTRSIRTAR